MQWTLVCVCVCVFFGMSAIWSHFGLNSAKSSCNIDVTSVVLLPVLIGTSQTSVVEGLSESVMDHLIIVLMNTVLSIMNQQENVLMETGWRCLFCYRLVMSKQAIITHSWHSCQRVWGVQSHLSVCLSVCLVVHALKGKWLALSTPNLVDTRHILRSSRPACIDTEVKRSKVEVTWLRKPSWSRGC